MAREWLVRRGTKVFGPVSDAKLAAAAQAKKLAATDELSCDGGLTWAQAGNHTSASVIGQSTPLNITTLASPSSDAKPAAANKPGWYTEGGFQALSDSDIREIREAIKLRKYAASFAGVALLFPVCHLVAIPLGVVCMSRRKKALLNQRIKQAVDALKALPRKSLVQVAGQKAEAVDKLVAQMVLTDSDLYIPFVSPIIQVLIVGGIVVFFMVT